MMGATEERCGLGCGIRAKTPGTDPRTGTARLLATATVFRVLTDNVGRAKKKSITMQPLLFIKVLHSGASDTCRQQGTFVSMLLCDAP